MRQRERETEGGGACVCMCVVWCALREAPFALNRLLRLRRVLQEGKEVEVAQVSEGTVAGCGEKPKTSAATTHGTGSVYDTYHIAEKKKWIELKLLVY